MARASNGPELSVSEVVCTASGLGPAEGPDFASRGGNVTTDLLLGIVSEVVLAGVVLSPAAGAVLLPVSTIVVALNAQLLRTETQSRPVPLNPAPPGPVILKPTRPRGRRNTMTAISARRARAFLLRGTLLAGLLAIIVGILGMHIMTGTRDMPAAATGHETEAPHAMQASGHPGHVADITNVQGVSAAPGITHAPRPSCADTGGCTMMSAMGGDCVPSPGTTTLAAPPPGTTALASSGGPITGAPAIGYGFIPRSPSPGQLSISRT